MNSLSIFQMAILVALVFVVPSASATDEDLQTDINGDNGPTSYASAYGHAQFIGEVSSASGAAHEDVTVTVSFDEGSDWSADQATISDCSGNGTTGSKNMGDLAEGETIEFCLSVSIQESGADNGDEGFPTISVTSNEDSTGTSTEARIVVCDWFMYSDTPVQSYNIGDLHQYDITIKNIKVDEDGEDAALDEPVYVSLSNNQDGWSIDSENSAWDKMELKATINYISAGGSFDLVMDIELINSNVPATSYVGSNTNIVFTGNDDDGVYQLVTLEAFVNDHFALNTAGAGNEYVNNGCSDDTASIGWTLTIKNFGNTVDSFEVTFDTSEVEAASWDVDGATGFNTDNLLPKFEGGAHSFNVGLHVPGGLAAGTSNGFTVTVTSDNDASVTQTKTFSATVNQCYGLILELEGSSSGSANPGITFDFPVTVTNTGNGDDTIEFQRMGPLAWSPTLSASSSTIPSGASSQVVFSLTVPSDASANAQSGMAMVHAYSEACGDDRTDCEYEEHISVQVSANQVYDITASYYTNESGVEMSSASVQEGMSVQMKFVVTNNGNGFDEVTLALANAPAWVALGQDTALIGPGQEATTLIDVMAPSSDALGDHTFQVVATSADGTTTSTTGDLSITIREKSTTTSGPEEELVEEDYTEISYSFTFTEDLVHLDVSPGASGFGCTEMVISNLGTITIDVDVMLSGDNITISPNAYSATITPEGNITTPICALALTGSEARIVQISALASGGGSNTGLYPVQVTSNFTASIDPYSRLYVQKPSPFVHCIGSTFVVNFTGFNNGNAKDIAVFELTNIQDLEDSGFTITLPLPILKYQIEPGSKQNLSIKVDTENVVIDELEAQYLMIVKISTTMDGENDYKTATYTLFMKNCGAYLDEGLPSLSFVPALISIGLLAILRRK